MSKSRTLIALVAVVAMMAITVPAHATITGSVEAECTANLPVFPNQDPTVIGTCDGTATGDASGTTVDGQAAYTVTGVGDLHAEFTYDETCTLGEPLQGTADGVVWIEGLTVVIITDSGEAEVSTGSVHADFSWVRTGTTATITLTNSDVRVDGTVIAEGAVNGVAEAAFVPLSVPDCANPAPITAQVAATAEFAA